MARPRKIVPPIELPPGQATYVLERLVRERRISDADVRRYVSEMDREIADLERRLYRLRDARGNGSQPADQRPSTERAQAHPPRRRRRTRSATAARRATQAPTASTAARSSKKNAAKQLGGRFAGLIRRLPEGERAHYHDIKKRDGVEAAIKALQDRRAAP